MNALKHMELIFGAVLVIACVIAVLPDAPAGPARQAAASSRHMPVVVIKAKRMTAIEKRQSLQVDAGAGPTAGS